MTDSADNPTTPGTFSEVACLACGNRVGNQIHEAREMMVGLRDVFHYLECGDCHSLTLADPPEDLSKYYAEGYYSFETREMGGLKRLLKRAQADQALEHPNLLGPLVGQIFGKPEFADWMRVAKVGHEAAILDVGCGSGHLLAELRIAGFQNLRGIDPFLDEDREVDGVRLRKARLNDLDEHFDFVMSHHSFEHMPDPADALRQIRRILKPGGTALIRCPLAGCYAWRHYGVDWVQLDASRHIFIPSRQGFDELAESCGMTVSQFSCDSNELQFEGSELYRRDIPLRSPERETAFTPTEIKEFRRRAAELNAKLDGDCGCFYLKALHEASV